MPTLEDNKRMWNVSYDWQRAGDEWSVAWGGVDVEWFWAILPRIHWFVPTNTILEIAPGYGKWTQFLLGLCKTLVVVDLSDKCIEACRERFASYSHIRYHVNDGRSLDMVPETSVDFVFSFDSLVHAEDEVIAEYLRQLGRKLSTNGIGFIHHSNLGEYPRYLWLASKLRRGVKLLARLGIMERSLHWRDPSMTAAKFSEYAEASGLHCIGQEKITWGGTRRLIDCMSLFTRKGSEWDRPNRIESNPGFTTDKKQVKRLSTIYGAESFPSSGS